MMTYLAGLVRVGIGAYLRRLCGVAGGYWSGLSVVIGVTIIFDEVEPIVNRWATLRVTIFAK